MTTSFDPRHAAARLAQAWKTGQRIALLPDAERPADTAQAYAIQALLLQEMGEGSAGWKIGGGSVTAMRLNPDAPSFGFLRPSRMFTSGITLDAPAAGSLVIEIEVAFQFGREVSPAREALDPAAMISGAYLSAEIVCSRFTDGKGAGALSFLADDAGFHAFVQGDGLPGAALSELLEAPATLWRDGASVGTTLHGDDRTYPLVALQLFWKRAAEQGTVIPAGAIITTGTLIRPVEAAPAGDYEGRLGDRRVTFRI